jgi:hypothetical protein
MTVLSFVESRATVLRSHRRRVTALSPVPCEHGQASVGSTQSKASVRLQPDGRTQTTHTQTHTATQCKSAAGARAAGQRAAAR